MGALNHTSTRGPLKVLNIEPGGESARPDLAHLIDAPIEAMLLGTVMADGEPAYRQVRFLEVNDFAVERHRVAWRLIVALADEVPPRMDEIYHRACSLGMLDSLGGLDYLLEMHGKAIPGLALQGFARSLRLKTVQRSIWSVNGSIARLLELGIQPDGPEFKRTVEELVALTNDSTCGLSDGAHTIEDLPAVGAENEVFTYIRDPELPCGAVVALTGDSGSGKSTLATAWVRDAIANGTPCLLLDRENPRVVVRDRMQRLGLTDGPLLRWFGGWQGEVPGLDSSMVREWVEKNDPKPLIVVDSLIAFIGGDENDALVMRAFTHQARRLADLGATVIVVHHDGKAETARDFRGSSDFKASFDQAFHVSNVGPDSKLDRIRLRCFKSRYGLTRSLIYHYAGGRFHPDVGTDAPAQTTADQLAALLRQNPGITTKRFEDLASKQHLGRNQARDFLADGVLQGVIRSETGPRNQRRHYPKESK